MFIYKVIYVCCYEDLEFYINDFLSSNNGFVLHSITADFSSSGYVVTFSRFVLSPLFSLDKEGDNNDR